MQEQHKGCCINNYLFDCSVVGGCKTLEEDEPERWQRFRCVAMSEAEIYRLASIWACGGIVHQ